MVCLHQGCALVGNPRGGLGRGRRLRRSVILSFSFFMYYYSLVSLFFVFFFYDLSFVFFVLLVSFKSVVCLLLCVSFNVSSDFPD